MSGKTGEETRNFVHSQEKNQPIETDLQAGQVLG